jgi:hypothetical protein
LERVSIGKAGKMQALEASRKRCRAGPSDPRVRDSGEAYRIFAAERGKMKKEK